MLEEILYCEVLAVHANGTGVGERPASMSFMGSQRTDVCFRESGCCSVRLTRMRNQKTKKNEYTSVVVPRHLRYAQS